MVTVSRAKRSSPIQSRQFDRHCVEHVHNFAKSRHLGFIARAAEAGRPQRDQWLFTLSDLMFW